MSTPPDSRGEAQLACGRERLGILERLLALSEAAVTIAAVVQSGRTLL